MQENKLRELQLIIEQKKFDIHTQGENATISEQEINGLDNALKDLDYIITNLRMYENALKENQFGALVNISKEMTEKGY